MNVGNDRIRVYPKQLIVRVERAIGNYEIGEIVSIHFTIYEHLNIKSNRVILELRINYRLRKLPNMS